MSDWSPSSWRSHAAAQQPAYDDSAALDHAVGELSTKPPLVAMGEVERLRAELGLAAEGRRFVLHGGDCAERFADCTRESLTAKFQVLLQMSLVLT
ncbi:MAG TPA: 3-deoxy-7-phosphoheptulonate synthase, partial [Candidatus Hydrogenedentes bacterium]|nr:3-deoxy-7-phosphoheptulonate synthase [Candidatus Hydrogenedentota bacterium]